MTMEKMESEEAATENWIFHPMEEASEALNVGPAPLPPLPLIPPAPGSAPPLCAGCNLRIVDKFYLSALDSKWHTTCLKCSECGMELESQISCYERDGLILCKEDYLRIYGLHRLPGAQERQCAGCQTVITRAELVMKARCFLYHVDCFKCVLCDVPLMKGDLFGMFGAVVYCQTHYRQQQEQQISDEFSQSFFYEDTVQPGQGFSQGQQRWAASPGGPSDPESYASAKDNNNSISPSSRKSRGRRKRDISEDEANRSCFPYLDPASGMVEKTKRARTSFKHHQLRIMKSHFQMNQNPDSRELKELATKTGLDKKVLQVWFQNARAKWRRMNNSQGLGSNAGGCGPPGASGLDPDSYVGAPPNH